MATILVSILAAAIAFLGVCIAWGQWYTARQKLVLDLFEKRARVVEDIDLALREVAYKRGDFTEWGSRLSEHRGKALYLFGSDVHSFLLQFDNDVYGLLFAHWRRAQGGLTPGEIQETTDDIMKGASAMKLYRAQFPALVAPYLRMDQKLPRPPSEWPGIWRCKLTHCYANRPDGTE